MASQTHAVGDGSPRGTQYQSEIAPSRSRMDFWLPFRVIVISGLLVGIPLIGVGSRLAMLLLRLTSPESVVGTTSADGFTIGQLTVGGSYNLLMMGMGLGVLGAGVYLTVKPLLLGPTWFRRLSTGLGSGLVVASMVISSESIDFAILEPAWLAIGLFIALPTSFGIVIGPVVDRVASRDTGAATATRPWVLPVALLAPFPLSWIVALFVAGVLGLWLLLKSALPASNALPAALRLVGQTAVVAVAGAGLLALQNDIAAIV